ncbi:hypothetical protein WR25_23554 [Diploscapter pachys]|uniref:Yippee domain-containing protein n=1 Tax=Diploscapter pachys TaxID=2018661 RepID=A0A2A2KK36_9BILA|nr:hypothetical protein WR25_23554 [Diploscapter pachys]
MGRRFLENLGGTLVYRCVTGKAYLFNKVVNITEGPVVERMMTTGKHLVRDVICSQCQSKIGWMYEMAMNDDQKYKEGHTILERALISVHRELDTSPEGDNANKPMEIEAPEVLEDSSDEEEMHHRIERGLAAIVERDYQVYDPQRFPALELLHHRRHGPQFRQLMMQQAAANNTFGNLGQGGHAMRVRQFHRRRPELPMPPHHPAAAQQDPQPPRGPM